MKFLRQRAIRERRLQEELEKEKLRFVQASKCAVRAIRQDLVIENWLRAYPTGALTLIAIAGFAAGFKIAQSQVRPALDIPSNVYES